MKHHHIIMLALLLIPLSYGLEGTQPAIALYTPQDNATITSQTQEFVFSIEAPEDGKTCKLLINGDEMRSYSNVIRRKSSRFTTSLPSETYTWQISCTLNDNTQITSQERTMKVDIRQTSCVERISKGSGSYRYVFTLGCLKKSPVTLSGLRANDWVEFKLTENERVPGGFESRDNYVTFYIVKLAKSNNVDYIQIYSSVEPTKRNILVEESRPFSALGHELTYTLDSVASKKAKLTARLQGYDYAAAQTEQNETEDTTTTEELPVEDTLDETETPPQQPPADTGTSTLPAEDTQDTGIAYEEIEENKTRTVITVIIIFILAIILLYLMLTKNKGEKEDTKKTGKKDEKKGSKKETKRESKQEKKKEEKRESSKEETGEIKKVVKEEKPKKKHDLEKERPSFIIEGPHK